MNNVEGTKQSEAHLESFVMRRELYDAMICSYLLGFHHIYLLTQLRGNIGDHLIWAGTEDLLRSGGVVFLEVSISDMVS